MAEIQITQRVCDHCKGKAPAKARHTCTICGSDLCNQHIAVEFTDSSARIDLNDGKATWTSVARIAALCPGTLCPSCAKAWAKVPGSIKAQLVRDYLEKLRPVIVAVKL